MKKNVHSTEVPIYQIRATFSIWVYAGVDIRHILCGVSDQQSIDSSVNTGYGPIAGLLSDPTEPRWGSRAEQIRDLAVSEPGISQVEIAERVGCTQGNVSDVLKRFLRDHSLSELQAFQENKAVIFEAMQYRTLASISDADIAKASYLQRITGAAILEDKIRLSRGQPTSMHVTALLDVAAMIREKRDRCELTRQQVIECDADDTEGE